MVECFLTEMPRVHIWKRTVASINGTGKTGYEHTEVKIGPLF
jgi:hypothetical protein